MDNLAIKILSINCNKFNYVDTIYELNKIEKQFCNNLLINEYFDILSGSGFGVLICLIITYKIPIQDIIEVYEKNYKFEKYHSCFHKIKKIIDIFGFNDDISEQICNIIYYNKRYKCMKNSIYSVLPYNKNHDNIIYYSNYDNNDKWINNNKTLIHLDSTDKNISLAVIIECMKKYVGVDKLYNNYALLEINVNSYKNIKISDNKYYVLANNKYNLILNNKYYVLFSNKFNYIKGKLMNCHYFIIILYYINTYFCNKLNHLIYYLILLYKMFYNDNVSHYCEKISEINNSIYIKYLNAQIDKFFLTNKTYKCLH